MDFSKKKIIVTGGAGFIGSALIRSLLHNNDCFILNIDKLSYASSLKSLESASKNSNYTFKKIDLNDFGKTLDAISKFEPDLVFHLAAESHVDNSISSPREFIDSNIVGTFNLLEAIRAYLIKCSNSKTSNFKLIHVSTDEVYGDLEPDEYPFTENSKYQPSSPYSASKASSDHLVKAWTRTYNLPFIITNCSNNYGPYQFPEKLIPVTIFNALSNKKIPIYGNGLQIRDWLHVEDHIDALQAVALKGSSGESYNIGTGNELTNIEIVKNILQKVRKYKGEKVGSDSLISYVTDRPGHDKRYSINHEKINKKLKWKAKIKFEDGIDSTVKWFIENKSWWEK